MSSELRLFGQMLRYDEDLEKAIDRYRRERDGYKYLGGPLSSVETAKLHIADCVLNILGITED